jgi:hypothetical protein
VLSDLDGVFSDLDDALNDFSTADLRSVDLHRVQLKGLRWSSATQWPANKMAQVTRDSVEVAPGRVRGAQWRCVSTNTRRITEDRYLSRSRVPREAVA